MPHIPHVRLHHQLTSYADGGGGDSLAEVVPGAARVDALVFRPQPGNVQRHVTEVVRRLETRA